MDPQDIMPSLLEELLPGIPNDVVLMEIATKLSRRDVALLSSLSRSWQQVIKSRLVYNATVCCHSLETCIVLRIGTSFSQGHDGIYLYSPSEESLYQIPEVPDAVFGAVFRSPKFIALEGNLYALGGMSTNNRSYQRVHVLDVAVGDMHWKECAALLEPRISFQCGIKDGKLYVFGGTSPEDPTSYTCASEFYDPKVDAWSPIKPMVYEQLPLRVTHMGEELFVACRSGVASSWQVYHPLKDEWRVVEPRMDLVDRFSNIESVFMMQGKFYSADSDGFHVYNNDNKSWDHWCSIAYDGLGPTDSVKLDPYSIVTVNNELFAMVRWKRRDAVRSKGWYILQSSGFSSNNRPVVWSIRGCPTAYGTLLSDYFNPLQLLSPIEL